MLKLDLPVEPGTFYDVHTGYFLPVVDLPQGQVLDDLTKLSLVSCMFDIYIVSLNRQRVGFYFTSRFTVEFCGSYIVAFMSKRQEATTYDTLIRTDELIVFNYPNRGTLAICPQISDEVQTIFEEQ